MTFQRTDGTTPGIKCPRVARFVHSSRKLSGACLFDTSAFIYTPVNSLPLMKIRFANSNPTELTPGLCLIPNILINRIYRSNSFLSKMTMSSPSNKYLPVAFSFEPAAVHTKKWWHLANAGHDDNAPIGCPVWYLTESGGFSFEDQLALTLASNKKSLSNIFTQALPIPLLSMFPMKR